MYWSRSVLLVLVALVVLVSRAAAITQCTRISDCSCQTEDSQLIDLAPLAKSPPWKTSDGSFDYEWNPCVNFQLEDGNDYGAAQTTQDKIIIYSLGFNNGNNIPTTTSNDVDSDGSALFMMRPADASYIRTTKVKCVCDKSSDVKFEYVTVSASSPYEYEFKLTAPHCCPGYHPASGGDDGGLSVGSVMCIIFFTLLFVYIVGGVVFLSAVRKAQGIERVPNVPFWSALPGLIKDGFLFVFTCGRRTASDYGKI